MDAYEIENERLIDELRKVVAASSLKPRQEVPIRKPFMCPECGIPAVGHRCKVRFANVPHEVPIFDDNGEWIGVKIVKEMSLEKFWNAYPRERPAK